MSSRLNDTDRGNLSRVIMGIFEVWNVNSDVQKQLLGLPATGAGKLLRSMQSGKAFPDDEAMEQRAEHLLAIHDCLRTAYPRSGNMASAWLVRANRHFGRRAPLSVMLEGESGLRRVRGHLDCTQNWHD